MIYGEMNGVFYKVIFIIPTLLSRLDIWFLLWFSHGPPHLTDLFHDETVSVDAHAVPVITKWVMRVFSGNCELESCTCLAKHA